MQHIAYPNFAPDSMYTKPKYDLTRWLTAMRQLYAQVHVGSDFKTALASVTSNWNVIERGDFEAWLEYYQSNSHLKYKRADFYMSQDVGGYYLPGTKAEPSVTDPMSVVQHDLQKQVSQDEKRKLMEDQRKRIIGRLHAAIRHLNTDAGHMLAGAEFERLLRSMHELLIQIQTVNKVSLSNQLYRDLIVRQANKLAAAGFGRSSGFLHKFAQNVPGKIDFAQGVLPIASKQSDGVAGSLTNPNPGPQAFEGSKALESDDPLNELSDNLETGGLTDLNTSEDEDLDDVELDDLRVEAQMAPAAPKSTPAMEVGLPEQEPQLEEKARDIDVVLDQALSKVTINDVISKIESIHALFQNRTISRELSVIDLMLSSLGLSSYFEELNEVLQKSYEQNNYSISRLSDILTKLRSAVSTDSTLLEPVAPEPKTQNIQQVLQQQKDQAEKRKEMRRKLQDDELTEETAVPAAPAAPIQPTPAAPASAPTAISQTPAQIV